MNETAALIREEWLATVAGASRSLHQWTDWCRQGLFWVLEIYLRGAFNRMKLPGANVTITARLPVDPMYIDALGRLPISRGVLCIIEALWFLLRTSLSSVMVSDSTILCAPRTI